MSLALRVDSRDPSSLQQDLVGEYQAKGAGHSFSRREVALDLRSGSGDILWRSCFKKMESRRVLSTVAEEGMFAPDEK